MKISEIYANGNFSLSFEVFPPRTDKGMPPLLKCVDELCRFNPGFISCTYGAGGTTQDQTLEIMQAIRDRSSTSTTAHFTCVGSTVEDIRVWLRRAAAQGVQNIMALRGDPPKGESTFRAVEGGLRYANELVKLIASEFPEFGIGVAGYPETHQEAPDAQIDLENLKRKVDAGADAIFTQLFYCNEDFFRFRDDCHKAGITLPIVPGLLPILSLAQIQRITSLCKARLPESLIEQLRQNEDDADAQVAVGVEYASRQAEELLRDGVPGIHFYVLNKHEPTARVLDNVASFLP